MNKQKIKMDINMAFILIAGLFSLLYLIWFALQESGAVGVKIVLFLIIGLFIVMFFGYGLISHSYLNPKDRVVRSLLDVAFGFILVVIIMFFLFPIINFSIFE